MAYQEKISKAKHHVVDVCGQVGRRALTNAIYSTLVDSFDPSDVMAIGDAHDAVDMGIQLRKGLIEKGVKQEYVDAHLFHGLKDDAPRRKNYLGREILFTLDSRQCALDYANWLNRPENDVRTLILDGGEKYLDLLLANVRKVEVTVYVVTFLDGRQGLFPRGEESSITELAISSASDFQQREFKIREPLLVTKNGHPVFHTSSINEVHAWRGIGKTNFDLGLGSAMAKGAKFLAWEATRQFNVLYVEGELPGQELQERLRMLDARSENFMVITPEEQTGCIIPMISGPHGRLLIETAVEQNGIEVLFLDSISSLANISTNDEEAWLELCSWMKVMRNKYGVAIFYMHHDGKGQEQRGHSKHEDLLDKSVHLYWPDGKGSQDGIDHLKCSLKFDKARFPVKEDSHLNIELVNGEFLWSPADPSKKAKVGRKADPEKEELIAQIRDLKNADPDISNAKIAAKLSTPDKKISESTVRRWLEEMEPSLF